MGNKKRHRLLAKSQAKRNARRIREQYFRSEPYDPGIRHVSDHPIRIGLSTSSVYPMTVTEAFAVAADLGYDGVEVMITGERETQDVDHIRDMVEHYQLPVISLHAPTLLVTPRVLGKNHWRKLLATCEMAKSVGATTVVVHPPFRWQGGYAHNFEAGVRRVSRGTGVTLAVENMFPWRAGVRELMIYLPHWDPVPQDYDAVTVDFSHAATAGADVMDMIRRLGPRLKHIHLTDGAGSVKDEHLVPGRGTMPVAESLRYLAEHNWDGDVVVEVNTRFAASTAKRDDMLLESLEFAKRHLGIEETGGTVRKADPGA